MKALYKGRVYHVVDEAHGSTGLVLGWNRETPSGKTVPAYREVDYSDPDLIVDPTDSDLGIEEE